eukprot:1281261-Amphidinium_carterae.1
MRVERFLDRNQHGINEPFCKWLTGACQTGAPFSSGKKSWFGCSLDKDISACWLSLVAGIRPEAFLRAAVGLKRKQKSHHEYWNWLALCNIQRWGSMQCSE